MVKYSPYDWETAHNPYPVYKELRDSAPVYRNEELGFWALSRHADVCAAHTDPETFSSAGGVTLEGSDAGLPFLIVMDEPGHRWHRKLVNGAFTPRRLAALEPFVRNKAAGLLDEFAERGEFDAVEDFAIRLPLDVISELLGIPEEFRRDVNVFSNQVIAVPDPDDPEAAGAQSAAAIKLIELYLGLVRERRTNPRDDVITLLLQSEVVDETTGEHRFLTDDEVAYRFMEMGLAGHETVAKLIPNALVGLFWYPDQRRRLAEDPALAKNAVEEFLRWDPPSHLQGRTTTRDVELHGVTIPAGEKVMLLTAAASHDDRVYDDPEALDIGRQIRRQVGFGFGIHACLGAALARLETRIALQELLARFPDYAVDGSRAVRRVQANVRGLSHLPIIPRPA
ncbi:cytochrome P450 [Yinghuangia sp. YIM S09857]|uniref:cytochrome P450 n=1 Tax=Yinghuangia sp. YIM S09857 TaxID=3436929 RepID=UPI003F537395